MINYDNTIVTSKNFNDYKNQIEQTIINSTQYKSIARQIFQQKNISFKDSPWILQLKPMVLNNYSETYTMDLNNVTLENIIDNFSEQCIKKENEVFVNVVKTFLSNSSNKFDVLKDVTVYGYGEYEFPLGGCLCNKILGGTVKELLDLIAGNNQTIPSYFHENIDINEMYFFSSLKIDNGMIVVDDNNTIEIQDNKLNYNHKFALDVNDIIKTMFKVVISNFKQDYIRFDPYSILNHNLEEPIE